MESVTHFNSAREAERFAKANDHLGYVHAGDGHVELDPSRVKTAPKGPNDSVPRSEVETMIANAVAAALANKQS